MAPRQVLADAASLYMAERRSLRVELQSGGGVDVARRVAAGEDIDVVVLASDAIDTLINNGHLLPMSRIDLMNSEIAIGVRSGSSHPDITDEQSIRDLVLNARSVSYSTGPSGAYLERLFERWGILAQVSARIVIPQPGVPVGRLIARGDVELGFQQLSELINSPGVDVVGFLPSTIQLMTRFTGGISLSCDDLAEANRFLTFVASSALDAIKQRHGMRPVRELPC